MLVLINQLHTGLGDKIAIRCLLKSVFPTHRKFKPIIVQVGVNFNLWRCELIHMAGRWIFDRMMMNLLLFILDSMLGNNMDVGWTILSIETIGKFYSHPYLSVGLSSEIWDSPSSLWRIDLSRGLEPRYHIIPSCCGGVSHFAPWPSIWIELILTVTCMLIFIRRQTWL